MVSFWIIGGTPILGQVGPVDTPARCFDCNGLMCKFAWCIYSNIHVYPHFEAFMNQLFHMSCVFFDAWALILLLCLRHCLRNAYAASGSLRGSYTFEGVPTQGQCPCKNDGTTYLFAYAFTLPAAFGNLGRNVCLRDQSPINILLSGMPCGTLQGHQPAGSKPHLAPCSSTSTQTPKHP